MTLTLGLGALLHNANHLAEGRLGRRLDRLILRDQEYIVRRVDRRQEDLAVGTHVGVGDAHKEVAHDAHLNVL